MGNFLILIGMFLILVSVHLPYLKQKAKELELEDIELKENVAIHEKAE